MSKRTLWLIIPWALFAVLAVGWVIYWHVFAAGAEGRVRGWIAQQSENGAEASVGGIVRHGFPMLLRLELQDAAYAPARGGWRIDTERVDLNLNLLNPSHVIFEAKAPIALARSDGAVTNISADTLIASVRMQGDVLAQAGIEADNLTLDDPARDGVLRAHKVVLNVRPDPRAAGEYQLSFDATTLVLPRPVRSFETFGLEVPSMRAAVVVERATALFPATSADPLEPWREAGGRLRFEALALRWGPLEATGTGAGGLDDQRRLMGALRFPIEHPAPVFAALSNDSSVDESARRALGLLAAGYLISGDDITLDVDAGDGVLRLEGLPVRTLPPVY